MLIELIGEEIYDEFDPHHQGAQLSSFIPPDSDAGAVSDPGHNNSNTLLHVTSNDVHAPALGSGNNSSIGHGLGLGSGPAIMKPIALKAKEGFDYLTSRSKSAPPIPRDQIGKTPSQSGVPLEIGDRINDEPKTPPVKVIDKKVDKPNPDPPTPHPADPTSISNLDLQPPSSQPQSPTPESTIPHTSTLGPHLMVPSPSRGASPASLEAYLLERKRRGPSGGGATPRIVTPAPGVKGKWFKSSPLSPTERDATEGTKRSKGGGGVTREGDGSVSASTTMMEGDGLS